MGLGHAACARKEERWEGTEEEKKRERKEGGRGHTRSVIIFHHRASVDEFERLIGQLGVVGQLLSDDRKLCIGRGEGEVQPETRTEATRIDGIDG